MPGETIQRPNGKTYRPRKVVAHAVVDEDELLSGVMVLGTHDLDRAQALADEYARWQLGEQVRAVKPNRGWYRDGFEGGRRCWVRDPERGAAGVWFMEIVLAATGRLGIARLRVTNPLDKVADPGLRKIMEDVLAEDADLLMDPGHGAGFQRGGKRGVMVRKWWPGTPKTAPARIKRARAIRWNIPARLGGTSPPGSARNRAGMGLHGAGHGTSGEDKVQG